MKFTINGAKYKIPRRSREGAWIEISTRPCGHKYNKGRSREGAWIEIYYCQCQWYMAISRSREGAWIEI